MSTSSKYPQHWIQPVAKKNRTELQVYNSLTRTKVPFVTAKSGLVTWYNCGPTVYDDSHLGHARNYVTQDFIRRILRDYFGYNVHFCQNITDIDDKIIVRARQNYLLEQFWASHANVSQELIDALQAAWTAYFNKDMASTLLPNATPEEKVSDQVWDSLLADLYEDDAARFESLKAAFEKFSMHLSALVSARAALTATRKATSGQPISEIELDVKKATETVLAAYLDAQKGSSVTDPAIFRTLPARMEESFFKDMSDLGIERPTTLTRVTEFVPEIVDFVQHIVDNGFAYEANGSVYFDVKAFEGSRGGTRATDKGKEREEDGIVPEEDEWHHLYAKLRPWSKGDASLLEEGEGSLSSTSGKKSATDFALWKASKPGEPAWPSPWGAGRPGWHIECSVMASSVFGSHMDIHSGGIDLAFPHHDNEIAQSEACHDCRQWVNYFIHTGHLHIEGLKMSKSLKNFITIQEALQKYSARQLRLAFLLQSWHGRMDFKETAMVEVRSKESLFNNFFANVKALMHKAAQEGRKLEGKNEYTQAEKDLLDTLHATQSAVHDALCDSFDTPRALEDIASLVSYTNTYISAKGTLPDTASLQAVAEWVTRMLSIFGLNQNATVSIGWGEKGDGAAVDREALLMPYLKVLSQFRDAVRSAGKGNSEILTLCDRLRDEDLVELGVALDDQPDGTALVKLVSSETLIKAREEKRAAAAAKAAKAEEKRLQAEALRRQKEEAAARELELGKTPPSEWFKNQTDKFSTFDEAGFPLTDKDGEPLAKAAQKRLKKELEAQVKRHEKYLLSVKT